jgi:ABC-type amino acid transport substrate-binding protein
MTLRPKQAAQVASAPPNRKKALKAAFEAQNQRNNNMMVKKNVKVAAQVGRQRPSQNGPIRKQTVTMPNFLDPLVAMPAPSVTSDGKALPHTSLVSADFQVGTTNRTILIVTNVGDSGTVGQVLNVQADGTYADGSQLFTIPTMATADIDGGASAARAMKLSVSVTNCSNALKRGGRVTYLNSSQRLPSLSSGSWSAVIEGIKSSPARRRITGDNLGEPLQLIAFPVDNIAYATFRPNRGAITIDEFHAHTLTPYQGSLPAAPRPMSVIAYVFETASDTQDYSVTIRASFYTRWPLTSVPGQSMRNMPTADPKVINHVRDTAETNANDLMHVLEGGAMATLGPRAAGALRNVGGAMIGRVGNALGRGAAGMVGGAEGMAAEVIGAEGVAIAEAALPLLV